MNKNKEVTKKDVQRLATDRDFLRLKLDAPSLNIFKAMGAESRELHHSNFLAFLFNPKSAHPFRDGLFKDFCHKNHLTLKHTPKLTIWREAKHNIDILLADEANKLVVVIENKVEAEESEGQLRRYRRAIENDAEYRGWTKKYYFLSMSGEKPKGDKSWKAIEYDLIDQLLGEALHNHRVASELGLILKHYRNILTGSRMTEDLDASCKKILKRNPRAAEALIRYGFSLSIETALIKSLVRGAEDSDIRPLPSAIQQKSNSSHVRFTSSSMPTDLDFQFFIYGGGRGIWLLLRIFAHKNRRLADDFTKYAKRHTDTFNEASKTGKRDWRLFYNNEIIADDAGLTEDQRVERIVEKWNDFLLNDFKKIEKKVKAFRRARSKR